jgi:putative OPT family oligopeptide transporter
VLTCALMTQLNSATPTAGDGPFKPYVSAQTEMSEFTLRALLLGLVMCVVLGAANAYLGLRAGMTIAATYPAAVIGMAVLRLFKGSVLEENFARTVGSIGESVAAGAAFTIPAFVILNYFDFGVPGVQPPPGATAIPLWQQYVLSSAMMVLGGILGIFLVTILRRVMVEDPTLPFPESVAASEIHKAGQRGAEAAMQLFRAMGVGALIRILGRTDLDSFDGFGLFNAVNRIQIQVGKLKDGFVRLAGDRTVAAGGVSTFTFPAATPAYLGVGYIIGPELGALNFAGGLLAWGLFVPLLVYFIGPGMIAAYGGADDPSHWAAVTGDIYRAIVRPIAVGGMLIGAIYTLWKMRKNLVLGIRRGIADVRKAAGASAATVRTEHDLSFKAVLSGIAVVAVLMLGLYFYFTGAIHAALLAGLVILVTGFFFAAVSGNLVGLIGSSNNPISGLTLATTIIAALTMVLAGMAGAKGIMAALGVAAVGCVSAAVAGEMLQDLKVGHILGGTPWKMQVGDVMGVVFAGLLLFWPLYLMQTSDVQQLGLGVGGFGGPKSSYAAPQAGLMAALAQGIVGGEMAWPLVIVGIALGFALILIKVRSPMLFAVGMYLPLETTFAIFAGGVIRWTVERTVARRGYNPAQKARVENAGVLAASGLIAGEALIGLAIAAVIGARSSHRFWVINPSTWPVGSWMAIVVFAILAAYLIYVPLGKAGRPDEPAPPTAVM